MSGGICQGKREDRALTERGREWQLTSTSVSFITMSRETQQNPLLPQESNTHTFTQTSNAHTLTGRRKDGGTNNHVCTHDSDCLGHGQVTDTTPLHSAVTNHSFPQTAATQFTTSTAKQTMLTKCKWRGQKQGRGWARCQRTLSMTTGLSCAPKSSP